MRRFEARKEDFTLQYSEEYGILAISWRPRDLNFEILSLGQFFSLKRETLRKGQT